MYNKRFTKSWDKKLLRPKGPEKTSANLRRSEGNLLFIVSLVFSASDPNKNNRLSSNNVKTN